MHLFHDEVIDLQVVLCQALGDGPAVNECARRVPTYGLGNNVLQKDYGITQDNIYVRPVVCDHMRQLTGK